MKHVVRKAYFDFEKEEKYLNEMSSKGLALTNYSWCKYTFEEAPRGKYIYRIELLENPLNHPESQNYIRFMEETGIEFVASYNRWVYFRREAGDGEFNIYSDIESKIKHYKRVRSFFFFAVLLNFFIGLQNFTIGITVTPKPPINLYLSIFSFVAAALFLIFLILPLNKKIEALKKKNNIQE